MEPSRRSTAPAIVAILIVIALPVLYVASTGPAVWLCEREYVSMETILMIYWPIEYAVEHNPWIAPGLDWYLSFFRRA